jgi:hypothetical protein
MPEVETTFAILEKVQETMPGLMYLTVILISVSYIFETNLAIDFNLSEREED